jgi:membrane-bound serine protease (ClpP class)
MNKAMAALLAISFLLFGAFDTEATEKEILIVTLADAISPVTAEFLIDALQQASDSDVACLIIKLDTPGGLVESMRLIVQAIYACKVPVVVYVTPSGARAASAGVMITMAADIAAMAPATNIGAAHPVGAGGKEINDTMSDKVTNDLVAFTKGIAQRQGRNAQWAEKAVRDSVSITAAEAVKANVIDMVAKDMEDLIRQIHGREVAGKGKLLVEKARRTEIKEALRTKILKAISNPNIAYILLMIGLAGLYFELSHPGVVFPGVVGGIALILAFFSLQTLPVNTAGILLIILAVIFFILELKVASYGMLSVAGIISMVLGSLMLFKGAGAPYQVAWQVFVPTIVLICGFFVSLAYLVVRAHAHPPRTGVEGLVGQIGAVKQVDAGQGKVLVHGELWQAIFNAPVSVGDKVTVVGVANLVLTVAPNVSNSNEEKK